MKIKHLEFKKSTIKKRGYWPQEFLQGLVSEVPSVSINRDSYLVWSCSIHGNYKQRIGAHLESIDKGTSGCPVCYRNLMAQILHSEESVKRRSTKVSQVAVSKGKESNYFSKSLIISKGYWPQEFLQGLVSEVPSVTVPGTTILKWNCKKHGVFEQPICAHLTSLSKGTFGCPRCAKNNCSSSLEYRLKEDLEASGAHLDISCKGVIKSESGHWYELDLFSEEKKVAIEVNGLYYHSLEHMRDDICRYKSCDLRWYHRTKTDLCEQKGIQLVHVWEDDLRDRYDVVLWMLKFKLGLVKRKRLMARKCIIQKVEPRERVAFYNKYHIQGDGQGICYGLYYQGHLISCMSVRRGPSNTSSKGAWELNRYASIHNYFVVGGFEKLFKFFTKTYGIHHWISYADRTVSDGSLYEHQGWKKTQVSNPDYKYVYKGIRYHKFNFRIKRFRENKSLKFKEGLSESQLAELNGITRIYDCGKIKYEKWV